MVCESSMMLINEFNPPQKNGDLHLLQCGVKI